MARRNPFQEVPDSIVKELESYQRRARKSRAVPFGLEKVSKREAQSRLETLTRADLEAMPLEQYQQLVQTVGQEAIMKVISREPARPDGQSFSDQVQPIGGAPPAPGVV